MIKFLFIHLRLLIQFILKLPKTILLAGETIFDRIKNKYYSKPHFKQGIGVYGSFGSGKGCFTIHLLRKYLCSKKYSKCNYRVLSNMTLHTPMFPGMKEGENYRLFTNVDDIDWLMETKIDEKTGKEVPAYDFGILVIDELCSVAGNRDFMNSKKGKGVITKNFLALLHQLRKMNVLVICQFQDEAIDITFRRLFDLVYCPHMHLFNRLNIVKVYSSREIFTYLADPSAPTPDYITKRLFICTNEIFKSYDTTELVKTLTEADYFRPNDPDAPAYVASGDTVTAFSHASKKLSFKQKVQKGI